MSRAFVKEADGADFVEALPDRPISPERNLVTAAGLALIEAELTRLRAVLAGAQAAGDATATAHARRDLRYWTARHASAEPVPPPDGEDEVRFGHRVTIERDDGRRQHYRIVGLDEADPAKGLISYASPLARALLGKRVGEVAKAGAGEAEIVAIER
jgi:transcription elongation GreA/GreB family factor